jgi:signal transduction histidine kinase/CheY-like chemotaxis protein
MVQEFTYLQDLVDNVPQMIWKITEVNGVVEMLYSNKVWNTYTNYKSIFDQELIHPEDYENILKAWDYAKNRKQFQVKAQLKRYDGFYHWFLIQGVSVEKEIDYNKVWYGSCTDIDDFVELEKNEKIAEHTRLDLARGAKILASDVLEKAEERKVAEQTRIELATEAKLLATEVIEKENERKDAEETRIDLAKKAQVLATHVLEKEEERKDAEVTRIDLARKAKVLASNVIEKEEQLKVAELTRINLAHNAEILAQKVLATNKLILQRELEKNLADKEVIQQGLEKKELSEEAKVLTAELIRRTVADQQLNIIINSIPVIIWVIDTTGIFTMSEGKGLIQIHQIPGSLVGNSIYDYLPEIEHDKIKQALNGHSTTSHILFKERHYETYFTALIFNTGVIGAIILFKDITQQKKLEDERSEIIIKEQTALRDAENKSTFLANMSHEIRTPLYGIMAHTEFLLETYLTKIQREYMQTINQSVQHLTVIVSDIMDIHKVQTGQIELDSVMFDPSDIIKNTILIMTPSANLKNLDIITTVSPYLSSHVTGDPNRLQQILVNILNNAIKFTIKGQIQIRVKPIEKKESVVFLIEIEDSGIGMSKETIDNIFTIFSQEDQTSTRTYGGTGLSMYISMQLAKLMGGGITVTSQVGVGSTFILRVEFKRAIPIIIKSTEKDTSVLSKLRFLIFEDNIINQRIIYTVLSRAGASVMTANNGQIGLDMWKNNNNFDLIIMDCHMPVMDGYDASRQLIKEGCTVPIIALTANSLLDNVQLCFDAGMKDVVTKPVKPAFLIQKILEWTIQKI